MLNVNLTRRTCLNPRPGFQSFFSVFTHISPLVAMFGWKIFVKKNPANQIVNRFSTEGFTSTKEELWKSQKITTFWGRMREIVRQ